VCDVNTEYIARKRLVGVKIKQARRAAGLSHDKLAAMVGSSRQHLIRLEQGLHMPGTELLERIAAATGKAVSELSPEDEAEAAAAADPRNFVEAMATMFERVVDAKVSERMRQSA
jgi:transcriptional regulator with XRE-family HTH domain